MATAIGGADQRVSNEDQGPVILGATLTVTIAALITMATRLYVRIRMIRNMGWDDYVMISAMVLVCHTHCFQLVDTPAFHRAAVNWTMTSEVLERATGQPITTTDLWETEEVRC